MALQPSLSPFILSGNLESPHTLEFFYCFICAHSSRSAKTLDTIIKPHIESKYAGKVKVIFRPQVQPWWPSSSISHEASLAVARVAPHAWWKYATALFANRSSFTDVATANLTPVQLREKLADFGVECGALSPEEVTSVKQLLTLSPNGGVGVTDDLKYCLRYSRQNSIHFSPTVLWDGLIVSEGFSSWGETEWESFFEKRVRASAPSVAPSAPSVSPSVAPSAPSLSPSAPSVAPSMHSSELSAGAAWMRSFYE